MVQSRKKVTVPRDDIQPYHKDLDGALVADEQNIIGQIWQAKPLPPSDWTTGLATRSLRGVDMRRPGATQAAHLLQRGRRPRTIKGYESKFERFCSFCEEEQIEAGFEPLCPMPASRATVLLFLGYLQDEDKVHAASLQPYMSAIIQAHIDFGFPAPAMGHDVNLARKGFGEVEGEHTLKTAVRSPLPARVAYEILQLGLRTTNTHTLRRCACLSVAFAWFARADTGILMRRAHVTRQADGMGLNERTKTVARHLAAPIWRAQSWEHDPASVFNKLLERWENSQNHAPDDFYWSTSNDDYTDAQWIPSLIGNWLSEILLILNIQPPAGVSWSGHSLRSGGATAAYSIGVDALIVKRFGIWKCGLSSAQVYIDVLALPDAAARLFFGHLLRNRSQDGADSFQQGIWRGHDLSLARHCTWRAHSDSPMVDITFVRCLSTTRVPRVELSSQVDNADNIDEPCPDLV